MKLLLGRLLSVRYCDMFPTGFKAMLLVLAKHSRAEEMTEEVGEMTHATNLGSKTGPRSPIDRSFHKRAAKLTLFGSPI